MSSIPKFTVVQEEDIFIVEIESGKYKGAQYSYNNIELEDKNLTYDLEVYNGGGFTDDKKFIKITKNILKFVLNTYINNHKIGDTHE
jgi:hypothetical protein